MPAVTSSARSLILLAATLGLLTASIVLFVSRNGPSGPSSTPRSNDGPVGGAERAAASNSLALTPPTNPDESRPVENARQPQEPSPPQSVPRDGDEAQRVFVRASLFSAASFAEAADRLLNEYGPSDQVLLRELDAIGALCETVRTGSYPAGRASSAADANWAALALLEQCGDFAVDQRLLTAAAVSPSDLSTRLDIEGPSSAGLVEAMVHAVVSGSRPVGESGQMLMQLYGRGLVPDLDLAKSPGEPVAPSSFYTALWLRECDRIGYCGPNSAITREFCLLVAPCNQRGGLEAAVREGLSPRDQRDAYQILSWLRRATSNRERG